jgi:hypothetical protein
MNARIEKIKKHFSENYKIYIVGGTCLVVGVIGGVLASRKGAEMIVDAYKLQINSPTTNNILTQFILPALGDPGNVVQCLETGTTYASQGQAARELGVSATNIGNHLHGKISDINGLHLTVLGKAGQPISG